VNKEHLEDTKNVAGELQDRAELSKPYDGLLPLSPQEAILEVRGAGVSYGDTGVLHDIYCHFPEKMVTAIIGPSGCGKSTLLKIINRTLELIPDARLCAGVVLFRGRDIYDNRTSADEIRKQIGIIHQRPIVFPMSVLENVLFGAKFHRRINGMSSSDYAAAYLEKVGLLEEVKDRLHAPANCLSGGQQQRLCLARTLANKPDLILMDEPCSAIDPVATQRIEQLIRELKHEYTIIVVTHNIAQAKRISEQAIFILGGRIIEAGSTVELFTNPQTELARSFTSGLIG
jgi:phosphate transport system ATP-binding protein